MKVETPQVRWHADDKGKNQALFGVSLLPAGGSTNILATAGNTFNIHLWKVTFASAAADGDADMSENNISSNNKTTFEFLTSLNRHESSINALGFSPDGLHLASASDTGAVIIWSVPIHLRGNNNGRYFWSQVTKETDLKVNIVPRGWGDGITDLSWSSDSKRLVLGTIDNTVLVCEDFHYQDATQETAWKCVHRNSVDHSHFVQGVAYDPQGVYLASMSSDRSVRIHVRKSPGKKSMKKKVLRTVANSSAALTSSATNSSSSSSSNNNIPPPAHQRLVEGILTDFKLEMCTKSKQIKYRRVSIGTGQTSPSSTEQVSEVVAPKPARQALFADESTLQSFVRRLAWSPDGAYLITPAVMWQMSPDSRPQYATALWGRHNWEEPARVLLGMEKPSVVVRPNPVLFQLPPSVPLSQEDEIKENKPVKNGSNGIPYRSIFAVLTWDSVLVYDTIHAQPLAVARGLHYAHLTDATWSTDGRHLLVCSSDGYVSVLNFVNGELGQVYMPPQEETMVAAHPQGVTTSSSDAATSIETSPAVSPVLLPKAGSRSSVPLPVAPSVYVPPCEPGNANILEGPPGKKQRRITPTCISAVGAIASTAVASPPDQVMAEVVEQAVDQMSLDEHATASGEARQKKRIQPMLISTN